MTNLLKRASKSLDDEPSAQEQDLTYYKKDFVSNSETSNNISSVLSAMVTHIEATNGGQTGRPASPCDPSTAEETNIDDLFESFAHEIACDLNLKDRGEDAIETVNYDCASSTINLGVQVHDQTNKTLEVK